MPREISRDYVWIRTDRRAQRSSVALSPSLSLSVSPVPHCVCLLLRLFLRTKQRCFRPHFRGTNDAIAANGERKRARRFSRVRLPAHPRISHRDRRHLLSEVLSLAGAGGSHIAITVRAIGGAKRTAGRGGASALAHWPSAPADAADICRRICSADSSTLPALPRVTLIRVTRRNIVPRFLLTLPLFNRDATRVFPINRSTRIISVAVNHTFVLVL